MTERAQESLRFWLKPILLGICLALGYEVTHRVMTIQINNRRHISGQFEKSDFPGQQLSDLVSLEEGMRLNLHGDVFAMDAALTKRQRKRAELQVWSAEEKRRRRELELALRTLKPIWRLSDVPFKSRPQRYLMPVREPVLPAPVLQYPFSLPGLS